MKPVPENHQTYRSRVRNLLHETFPGGFYFSLSKRDREIYNRILSLDLEFADSLMEPRYSFFGAPPRQPSCMFRSLLLSIMMNVISIPDWAGLLKSSPFHAILSGFRPGDTPGASTFYDFFDRLWLSDMDNFSPHVRKPHPNVIPPKKKGEKAEPVGNITAESLFRFYKEHPASTDQPYALLFRLFKTGFLDRSVSRGLINPRSLSLAGDGTPVYTSARLRCRDAGDGSGLKWYSQPDCDCGWDSSRYCFYYGYDLYLLTASDSAHNLPVFPLLDPASMHDSIGFIHAFMAMRAFLPEYKVSRLLLDSAHDNLATYLFCRENGITPFIDLNLKGMKTFEQQGVTFSAVDSRPICMNGEKMVRDGAEKKRMRIKYRCPYAWSDIHKCPHCDECCSTNYGKVIHVASSDNPRFFCIPARDSKEWKETYKARTSSERCNKQFKNDRHLEGGRHRSSKCWYCRLYLTAMCIHLDAWGNTA